MLPDLRIRTLLPKKYRNCLLNAMPDEVLERLCLRPVTFEVEHEIEFPGEPIRHLYFVEVGMASMTVTFQDGSQVEVGMFGYESVIGISALMGTRKSLNRVYTQIAGHGYSCPVNVGRREFERGGVFQRMTLAYVQTQIVQSAQSTGCNARHNLEQRLARWLLICADRANSQTFRISQQFLSEMLGSTRPTVSIVAHQLKAEGLIEYTRGTITILEQTKLEARACECYGVIKGHLDNLAEFDSGMADGDD